MSIDNQLSRASILEEHFFLEKYFDDLEDCLRRSTNDVICFP